MDVERTEERLNISSNDSSVANLSSLERGSAIHLLPASAKEDVHSAQVRQYFSEHIKAEDTTRHATLLGHTLVGRPT